MSKLPLPNTRSYQGSPPIKNRKALSNISGIINSPTHSKHSSLDKEITNRKMEARRVPKTNIPSRNISSETMTKVRNLTIAGLELKNTRKIEKPNRQSSIFDPNSLRDPAAIRKQEEMDERLEKMVDVQRRKLDELTRKIKDFKDKHEELSRSKISLQRNAIDLQSKIDDAEVNSINMDHKIEVLEKSVEKNIAHEEQMNTVKLKEQQNILIRELDELKEMLNQELQNAQMYKDDQSVEEIGKLEEQTKHLSLTLSSLKQGTKERLSKERENLEKELEKVVAAEEVKGEELAKKFEEKSNELEQLKSQLNSLESQISTIQTEKTELARQTEEQLTFQSSFDDKFNSLEKQIQELTLQNATADSELTDAKQESDKATALYNESKNKLEKEKKLRRRIENSIQELNNKLRVYTRVLDADLSDKLLLEFNKSNEDQKQNLTINDSYFTFDKVFSTDFDDQAVSDEIVCLTENNLNGANVSIIVAGYEEESLIYELLRTTIQNLKQREDKYKPKQWEFNYNVQYLSITTEGVVDLIDKKPTTIKLENRAIQTQAKAVESIDQVNNLEPPNNASTLIKMTVSGSNPQKSFVASTYLLNLSQIKSSDLILHAVTKVRENKFSTSEFAESPMYQLIHFLYSNTKSLTLFNLSNDGSQIEENKKLLELATLVNQTDSIPVKRVYSTFTSI